MPFQYDSGGPPGFGYDSGDYSPVGAPVNAAIAGIAAVAYTATGAVVATVASSTPALTVSAAGLAAVAWSVLGGVVADLIGDGVPAGRYSAQNHLVDRFGQAELIQLTNPTDRTAVAINATRVFDAIADIDALITAKLQARYAMPLATVPRVLRNIACDLVRARLYEDRITDHVSKRETAALKLLDEISAGKLQLGLDEAGQPTPSSDGPQFTAKARVFSAKLLSDYAP